MNSFLVSQKGIHCIYWHTLFIRLWRHLSTSGLITKCNWNNYGVCFGRVSIVCTDANGVLHFIDVENTSLYLNTSVNRFLTLKAYVITEFDHYGEVLGYYVKLNLLFQAIFLPPFYEVITFFYRAIWYKSQTRFLKWPFLGRKTFATIYLHSPCVTNQSTTFTG